MRFLDSERILLLFSDVTRLRYYVFSVNEDCNCASSRTGQSQSTTDDTIGIQSSRSRRPSNKQDDRAARSIDDGSELDRRYATALSRKSNSCANTAPA